MDIFNTNDFDYTTTAVAVEGGEGIIGLDGHSSSLGFSATRNGVNGYVIAGHHGDKLDEIFAYGSTPLGYVTATAYEKGSIADAAFIRKYSGVNNTYMIGAYACRYLAESISDMPVGTVVYAYGAETGLTSGKVKSNLFTVAYDTNGDNAELGVTAITY